jgi:hypothetical protein
MAQVHETDSDASYTPTSQGWAGWVVFAATMLVLIGCLHIIQGLVAMFDEGVMVTARKEDLVLMDIDVWGGLMLVWGFLLAGTGVALAYGSGWARWFSIFLAFVGVILQIGFLSAYPIWSTIVIALDIFVIYALTARWDVARAAMDR